MFKYNFVFLDAQMKTLRILVLLFIVSLTANSQHRFVKEINDPNYGLLIRVVPSNDMGFVVLSLDSLRLTKFNSCGESEWNKKYHLANTHSSLADFIRTDDGGYAILTRILNGSVYGSLLTKLDSIGNIIWSKSFEDTSYNHFPYTLCQDQQGNYVIFANVAYIIAPTTYNMICKINGSGNLISTRFYNYGGTWGGAIVTSDNGVLIRTGWIFIKTDNFGNVQWTTSVLGAGYNYFAPVEVSDGYIFSGYDSNNKINFCKLSKQGNQIWGGRKNSNFNGTPPKLRKKNNGNLVGIFNYTTIVEFDKDLNIVTQNTNSFSSRDICFIDDDHPIIAGASSNKPFIGSLNSAYQTNCDIPLHALNFTLETATANVISTIVSSYNLNTVTRTYGTDTVSVSVTPICILTKALDLGNDTLLCKGTTMVLQNRTGFFFDHYQWSTGQTTSTISINQPGLYWLLVRDDCNESRFNDTVWINIKPAVEANLGEDLLLCENTAHPLFAPDCDSCSFFWSTGSISDSILVNEQGTYWLSVKNNNGCISNDTVNVLMSKCECEFYIPNSFTPNNDGLNELFKPVYYCDIADYSLSIFNRWGALVYQSNNIDSAWNGKFNNILVPTGVYCFVVSYQPLIKGKANNRVTKTGIVNLIY